MDSEFVKECTSVLKAAEILCPEITRCLKLSVFFANSTADRWMIWREIHSVSLKKRVKMCWHVRLRLMGVQTWQILIILLFYSSFQWELALSNWPVTKGKTCGAEVLSELAYLLCNDGLTWARSVVFVSDWPLAVINQSKY